MATLRDNLIFDVHDEDSPNGAALARLTTQAKGKFFRLERNGTGSGGLTMALSRSQIQYLRKDRLVRVYYPPTSPTEPIGSFILQKRSSLILTKRGRGGRQVSWTGSGALSYLARARMAAVSYLDPGGMGPLEGDGTWRFHLQGSWVGAVPHSLGAYLYRAIREATDPDRPQQPLANLTIDFDASTDSNGNPWTPYEGEFAPQIGDSVLDVALELMKLGLWVEMEHNLLLHAYNSPQGRDLTGPAWAPGVVRFQAPTGRVVSTGNIKDELTSTGDSEIELSTELVGNGEVFGWVPNPAGANVVREGYLRVDAGESAAQTVAAEADMAGRDRASDTIRLRVLHGNDEAHGLYLFGTRGHASAHAAPGDLATLNAATAAEGGHVDDPQEIAAITWTDRARGPATDVVIDFGSGYRTVTDRQGQGSGGACTCASLRLCVGSVGPNVLLGLAPASIKVSSSSGATSVAKEKAVDGDDTTPSHWTANIANGVDEEYWAGDLGDAVEVGRYRVKQGYSVIATSPPEPEGASEMRIYGSNDPAAWSWLPAGKLVADPPANGWVEVAVLPAATTGSDTGSSDFGSRGTYRYWLLRASAGPAAGVGEGWNVQEVELYAVSCSIEDVGDTCAHGNTLKAADCGHVHRHPLLTAGGPYHSAAKITETTDGDVQTALNLLRARAWKQPVRAATTAAGTLASSFENGDTVDGVVLATGDRILVKDQAAGAENGIYVVAASGAPTRATDMDASSEVLQATVPVSEGTANADKVFRCTTNAPITLGTTALVFTELSGGGSALTVEEADGTPSVAAVDKIKTAGITVTDQGSGDVLLTGAAADHGHASGSSAKASATADLAATTATAADITGASLSLEAGTWIVAGNFDVAIQSDTDRQFEGILDVAGTDENDLAVLLATGLATSDRQQVVQMWRITLGSTSTVKLQARHSGGAAGDFKVNAANTTITAWTAPAGSPNAPQRVTDTAAADHTIASSTIATVHSGLDITFTAPPSGRVLFIGEATVKGSALSDALFFIQLDSGADAIMGAHQFDGGTHPHSVPLGYVHTGLTPGQSYVAHYRWRRDGTGTLTMNTATRGGGQQGTWWMAVPLP